jgi:hypothetical protein
MAASTAYRDRIAPLGESGGFKESGSGKDLSVLALEDDTRIKPAMLRIAD